MTAQGTVLWYCFLLLIALGFQRVTRCLSTLNVFTLFLVFFLLRHDLTVPFDATVNERVTNYPISSAVVSRTALAIAVTYVGMLCGIWLTREVLRTPDVDPARFGAGLRVQGLASGVYPDLFWMTVVGVVGLVALVWGRVPRDILLQWREGLSAEQYRAWREAYGSATHYSVGLVPYFGSLVRWAFLPTIVYMMYSLRHHGLSYRIGFWVTLILSAAIGLISGQKAPTLFLLMGLFVTAWLGSGRVAIRLWDPRLILAVAVTVFLVLPGLYAVQYPFMDYVPRLQLGAFRLTSEADRGLQLYFHFYPQIYPHLLGASSFVLNKVLMLGYSGLPPEQLIPVSVVGPDYTDTWNAAFIGTAWVDFGWWGVALESVVVGLVLQFIHHWFVTSQKSAALIGVYAGLIIAASRLSEVSLFSALLSWGLGSSLLLFLLIKRPLPPNSPGTPEELREGPGPAAIEA